MASNTKILTNSADWDFTLGIEASEVADSMNITNNTTKVKIKGYLNLDDGSYWTTSYKSSIKIYWYDNYTAKETLVGTLEFAGLSGPKDHKSIEKEITVIHNADGSLSGYAKVEFTKGSTTSAYCPPSDEVSTSSFALTKIPRTSSCTVSGTELGKLVTVTISRTLTSFTHKVEWKIGDSAYVTASSNATTSASFTPDISYASQYPNSSRCACTVRITTYNGSAQIGESITAGCWLDIPASVKPTCNGITFSRIDNGVPSSWGVYVQGYSKVTATTSGTGIYGSTISSYYISGVGTSTNASSLTSGVLTGTGTYSFSASVTDSRSRTSDAKTGSITVYAYSKPSVSISAVRCNSDGTISSSGTCLWVTCNYNYASVNGKNTISKSISCNGASNTSFENGKAFKLEANCSISNTYTITATVTDGLGNKATATYNIPTAERIINIKPNGKGWAFGGFATKDNTLQVYGDVESTGRTHSANHHKDVQLQSLVFGTNTTEIVNTGTDRFVAKVFVALNGSLGCVEDTVYVNNGGIISTKRLGFDTPNVKYSYDSTTKNLTITCTSNWSYGFIITLCSTTF